MIVNIKIKNKYLGYPGTLGAIVTLHGKDVYGLTCFHNTFRSMDKVEEVLNNKGQFLINDEGFNNGDIVGEVSSIYNPKLDYTLIKLSPSFIDYLSNINFIQSSILENPYVGMHLVRFDPVTKDFYKGIIQDIQNEIIIMPNQEGDISKGGDSGSIWLVDSVENYHAAVGLHNKKILNSINKSAIPLFKIKDEIEFKLYNPNLNV